MTRKPIHGTASCHSVASWLCSASQNGTRKSFDGWDEYDTVLNLLMRELNECADLYKRCIVQGKQDDVKVMVGDEGVLMKGQG